MTSATHLLPILIRAGRYEASLARCPGQKRIATMKNGDMGRTIWLPGLAINLRWGAAMTEPIPRAAKAVQVPNKRDGWAGL